jgi:hypothetical protein
METKTSNALLNKIKKIDRLHSKTLFFFLVAPVAGVLALSGYPFAIHYRDVSLLRALFRIAVSGIVLLELLRYHKMSILVFGYSETTSENRLYPTGIFVLYGAFAVSVLFGFITDISALMLAILHGFIYYKGEFNHLGLGSFQTVLFHLPFLGTGQFLSIDASLGIDPILGTPFMLNSLFIVLGISMATSGFEKIHSPLWRSGSAVYDFITLPHLTRFRSLNLLPHRSIFLPLTYAVILFESTFIFVGVDKFLLLVWLLFFCGFCISLFTFVDLSFIGEMLLAAFALLLAVLVLNFETFPQPLRFAVGSWGAWFVTGTVTLSTFIISYPQVSSYLGIRKFGYFINGLTYSGQVFNEQHIYELYPFKLEYIDHTGKPVHVAKAFDEQGLIGTLQHFRPRHLQGSMYAVGAYCRRLCGADGDPRGFESNLVTLCYYALREHGVDDGTIRLSVKRYDPRDVSFDDYVESEWVTIGECVFKNGRSQWLPADPPDFSPLPYERSLFNCMCLPPDRYRHSFVSATQLVS